MYVDKNCLSWRNIEVLDKKNKGKPQRLLACLLITLLFYTLQCAASKKIKNTLLPNWNLIFRALFAFWNWCLSCVIGSICKKAFITALVYLYFSSFLSWSFCWADLQVWFQKVSAFRRHELMQNPKEYLISKTGCREHIWPPISQACVRMSKQVQDPCLHPEGTP